MFGVYCLKDKDGNVMYIGKGKVNEKGDCNRWRDHASAARAKSPNKKKYRVHLWMAKHNGWSFSWIQNGMKEQEAFALEKKLINEYRALRGRALLNSAEGGVGMTSEEARRIFGTPEARARQKELTSKRWQDEKYRRLVQERLLEANGRDYRREQSRQKALTEWSKEERKEAARRRAKELWADPVWSTNRRKELVERNKAGRKEV